MSKKPREPLKLTYVTQFPLNHLHEEVLSKECLKTLPWRRAQWDKPRQNPALHGTATYRVFQEINNALIKKREYAKRARVHLDEQWKELQEKEDKLRESFINLSAFVKGNAEKRLRAIVRLKEEQIIKQQRIHDINKMTTKFKMLQSGKKQLDESIKKRKLYERFLDAVVTNSEEFRNIDDLMSRFDALVCTKNHLAQRQVDSLRELDDSKAKMAKMIEEFKLKAIGLNNMVAHFNTRYQTAKTKANDCESLVIAIRDQSLQRLSEMAIVRQAIWNMYQVICLRQNAEPKFEESDVENQLNYIKSTLHMLKYVKTELQRLLPSRKDVKKRKPTTGFSVKL